VRWQPPLGPPLADTARRTRNMPIAGLLASSDEEVRHEKTQAARRCSRDMYVHVTSALGSSRDIALTFAAFLRVGREGRVFSAWQG
jgi:hypothetical protein